MYYDKDEIKNSLTLEQIYELVEELGAAPPRHQGQSLVMETICHNLPGEGTWKLQYYDNTKLFRCYTECHEAFDVFQLVQKVKEVQYNEDWVLPKAVAFVAQRFGIQGKVEGFEGDRIEDWKMIQYYTSLQEKIEKSENKVQSELNEYDATILDRLSFVPIESWYREGITIEVMKRYGIKYYPTDCKIVIPHWDTISRLIGIRGRTLVKKDAELYGKYMPIKINGMMYNHPLSFALYGLNFNKENIKRAKKAIIFEGEKSVLLYESIYGAENNISVASCGSSISLHQFEILRELGVEEIIIAYDRQFKEVGDKEFLLHVKSLKQLANKFNNYITVSLIFDKNMRTGYKDSPIDNGKAIFEELLSQRIIIS